ncbi:GerMN domain-containing protein [Clostridium sp. BNL1100]|uniref:GerMN domain-containing protein n=1 Tax=Clostridium sp. BNL1100 TaxID=755731 RepID=UPI00024A7A42|nr:GerMN domain-containing protein [Clostridium sp. BNL1100]AEY65288.1 spore germination protein [Clostridium sp. BNL1100]
MKKIISIVLVIMLLSTGCSFIGHKEEQEPSIQAANQTLNSSATNTAQDSKAAASATASSSKGLAMATGTAAPTTTSSMVSGNYTGSQINGLVIDNGAGKGMVPASDKTNLLITLYYKNKKGLLVPVTRTVKKQEGLAKAAVLGLVDEAVTKEQLDYYGLYPVLPKGTKIKGINIKDKVAVIDFSKEFLNLSGKQEEQEAVASVVYTLTGFSTVSDVRIRVEGKEITTLENGTDLSILRNRSNTLINSSDTQIKDGCVKCDLYYVSDDSNNHNYLVPVSVQIPQTDPNGIPELIFNELSKKPDDTTYFTSIPEGTKLISFDQQGSTAVLDFSSQITNYGGSEKEDSLLNQIYYTISQMKGIQKIKLLINGMEKPLPEGTEVASAKSVPVTFNKVIDN